MKVNLVKTHTVVCSECRLVFSISPIANCAGGAAVWLSGSHCHWFDRPIGSTPKLWFGGASFSAKSE